LRTLDPRVGDMALRIAKFYYIWLTSVLPLEVVLISYILMPRVTDLLAVFDGIPPFTLAPLLAFVCESSLSSRTSPKSPARQS